jgi:CheY-like chemotaxis protein
MKILIIYKDQAEAHLLPRMLERVAFSQPAEVDSVPREAVATQQAALAVADTDYDCVLLPLTLPGMMSLYLAEVTHQLGSATRLILRSQTNAPEETLLRLFDAVLRPPFTSRELQGALGCEPTRLSDQRQIDEAIEGILLAAACFGDHHGRPCTDINRYRKAVRHGGGPGRESPAHSADERLLALGKTLPALAADLRALQELLALDVPSSLNKMRYIVERVLLQLCLAEDVSWGAAEPTLERMIGPVAACGRVPKSVALHARTVQLYTSPGSHFQESPLSDDHVTVARAALVYFLSWFEGSPQAILARGSGGATAEPRDAADPPRE